MAQPGALHQALTLVDAPLLAQAMRGQALPPDVRMLLEIVAGNDEAEASAAEALKVARERVREAAVVYLQHVVFAPNADAYRTLAVAPDAAQAEIREHVMLLLKWLHPDRAKSAWESAFAHRVVDAWNALKTTEKRGAYDASLARPSVPRLTPSGRRRAMVRPPRAFPLVPHRHRRSRGRAMRLAAVAAAIVLAALVVLAPRWVTPLQGEERDSPAVAANGGN